MQTWTTNFLNTPILNSPYDYPVQHWELDDQGQPTMRIIERRRWAEFITPVPKPRKRKESRREKEVVFDEGRGLSSEEQQYAKASELCDSVTQHLRFVCDASFCRCSNVAVVLGPLNRLFDRIHQ